MTVQDLLLIQNGFTPALVYLNRGKVKNFDKQFGFAIKRANDELAKILNEYVVIENGNFKTENNKFILKNEEMRGEFEEKRNKILFREV